MSSTVQDEKGVANQSAEQSDGSEAEELDDFDPKAWRFRKPDCGHCQNGAWEVQQQFPEEIDMDEVDSYHLFQHQKGSVEDEEPLYSEKQLKKAYQLGRKDAEGENR